MKLGGIFRTRHPDRNCQTDADRRERLYAAFDAMQPRAASTNAALPFDAIADIADPTP